MIGFKGVPHAEQRADAGTGEKVKDWHNCAGFRIVNVLALWIAVAAGGAVGTLARHGVNVLVARLLHQPSPYATAAVNLIGAGIIGVLAGAMAAGRLSWSVPVRTFVFVGILGGFTTFSSFMLDTLTLAYTGEPGIAMANVAGQVLLGLAAVWTGYAVGLGSL
jgi:CrcB protein